MCIRDSSNVGAEVIRRSTSLGFATRHDEARSEEEAYQKMRDKLLGELKKIFRPEFLNRVDGVIVFRALTRDQIKQIVALELNKVRTRLAEHEVELRVTDAATEFLADKGYNPEFGARHLRRTIQHEVEDVLSEGMLSGEFQPGDVVLADLEGDAITMRVVEHNSHPILEQEVSDTAAGDRILEAVFH